MQVILDCIEKPEIDYENVYTNDNMKKRDERTGKQRKIGLPCDPISWSPKIVMYIAMDKCICILFNSSCNYSSVNASHN